MKKHKKKIDERKYFKNTVGLIVDGNQRILVLEKYKIRFISNMKNQLLHPGIKRTYLSIKNYFKCNSLKRCITQIIKRCEAYHPVKNHSKIYGTSSGYIFSKTI